MAEGDVLFVDVVAADRRVWEGEALSVIVRTMEGDIGILPTRLWAGGDEPIISGAAIERYRSETGDAKRSNAAPTVQHRLDRRQRFGGARRRDAAFVDDIVRAARKNADAFGAAQLDACNQRRHDQEINDVRMMAMRRAIRAQ